MNHNQDRRNPFDLRSTEMFAELLDKEWGELANTLQEAISAYFPELANLHELNTDRIQMQLKQGEIDPQLKSFATLDEKTQKKILAATAIRFIDDFIDDILWPKLEEFNPLILYKLFKGFMNRVLEITKAYDSNIPKILIDLPLIEMNLELFPTQTNFDSNIERYVRLKALDINYIKSGLTEETTLRDGLLDISRELIELKEGGHTVTDFTLLRFLSKNKIDPQKLIELIVQSDTSDIHTYELKKVLIEIQNYNRKKYE